MKPAILLIATLLPLAAFGQEMRTWKDKSGRALEGSMVGVDAAAGTVKVRRADNSEVSIPIAMLSEEDVAYARAKWQEMQSSPAPTTATPAPSPAAVPGGPPAPPRPQITPVPLAKFKLPSATDYLRVSPRTRPRLVHAQPGWDHLKNLVKTDPSATAVFNRLKEAGEKLLEAPEQTRIFGEQTSRVNPGSKAVYRMALLGALHLVDGDPRWIDRGARELAAMCDKRSFSDWYSEYPQAGKDFLIAACIGYDWLHAGLNKQLQEDLKTRILTLGIPPLIEHVNKFSENKDLAAGIPGSDIFGCAAALIFAALAMHDEDNSAAKKALSAAAKVFGSTVTRFSPGGALPHAPDEAETILDYTVLVLQTLRACGNQELSNSFATLEGFTRAGDARVFLAGPTGQLFNYGNASSATLHSPWVGTWLSGVHGNPGLPALTPPALPSVDSAFLNITGHLLYHNPHAAGSATPATLDAVFPGAEVASMRSAWNDRNAMFLAIKGGDNRELHGQLDIGSFVLDAGGQRWAIELGTETDRAPGMGNPLDHARRFGLYRLGSMGQNTLIAGGSNQALDARAPISGFASAPDRGNVLIEMKSANSGAFREHTRGAALARGAQPYAIVQDDVGIKGTQTLTWTMHTRAEVALNEGKATLTQGGQTLTAVILSPKDAKFTVDDAPEQLTPLSSLKGIRVLKVALQGAQGDQSISVAFHLGDAPVEIAHTPLATWIPKR
jgi:hypothetical protein